MKISPATLNPHLWGLPHKQMIYKKLSKKISLMTLENLEELYSKKAKELIKSCKEKSNSTLLKQLSETLMEPYPKKRKCNL